MLCYLEFLVAVEGMLLLGDTTMILLGWNLEVSPIYFLLPLNQQANKGVTVLAEVSDPEYQEKIEILLHNGGKEGYV